MKSDINVHQTQKVMMTPQLKQALRILQMPVLELIECIENEAQANPVLEIEEVDMEYLVDILDLDDEFPVDWKEYFDEQESYRNTYPIISGENSHYESIISSSPTLEEHLRLQLDILELPDIYNKIGMFIIQSLDDNGYLRISKYEISNILNIDRKLVSETLKIIQRFDPAGVGARSLKECLLIQLKKNGILDKNTKRIVLEHLKELAKNNLKNIAKQLNIPVKNVQAINDVIKKLEPKPGREFSSINDIRYILPDVIVTSVEDDYVVTVSDCYAPRLQLSQYYKGLLQKESEKSNTHEYLQKKLNSAVWLIKCIEQRRLTLYNVVKRIIEYQKDFFDNGIKDLKPLRLMDVADSIGVHESTVSRAISGKYVQTPRGLFELKYFFSSALNTTAGMVVSSESIKRFLREIIENENDEKPISDQKIAESLKCGGIEISRRTVAKYRELMNIPSSSKRKRY